MEQFNAMHMMESSSSGGGGGSSSSDKVSKSKAPSTRPLRRVHSILGMSGAVGEEDTEEEFAEEGDPSILLEGTPLLPRNDKGLGGRSSRGSHRADGRGSGIGSGAGAGTGGLEDGSVDSSNSVVDAMDLVRVSPGSSPIAVPSGGNNAAGGDGGGRRTTIHTANTATTHTTTATTTYHEDPSGEFSSSSLRTSKHYHPRDSMGDGIFAGSYVSDPPSDLESPSSFVSPPRNTLAAHLSGTDHNNNTSSNDNNNNNGRSSNNNSNNNNNSSNSTGLANALESDDSTAPIGFLPYQVYLRYLRGQGFTDVEFLQSVNAVYDEETDK